MSWTSASQYGAATILNDDGTFNTINKTSSPVSVNNGVLLIAYATSSSADKQTVTLNY